MHDACLTMPYWKVWPTVKRSSERGGHTDGTNRDRAISDHISDAALQMQRRECIECIYAHI